jgi:lysophospholipase L1-like esterase
MVTPALTHGDFGAYDALGSGSESRREILRRLSTHQRTHQRTDHRAVLCALAILATSLVAPRAWATPPLAIVVGDSIAREYPLDYYGLNIEGWGHYLAVHLSVDLTWRNDAYGSQSTKSFLAEGRWANTIAANPQYIFIQFGLGDESGVDGLATDPETDFRANLHQMISDAQGIGAVPILVTPPVIRWFYAGTDQLGRPNGLEPWATAMIEQANADGVGYVDLQAWSSDLADSLGIHKLQDLYGFVWPAGPWAIPAGTPDQLHFSHFGADQAAGVIIDRLRTIQPDLVPHLQQTQPVSALPGFAWKLFACGALLGLALSAAVRARSR